ncbi:MAG: hypothetical protein JWM56_143 [Candidatus Peribacteria bacterium]|nr:hypothetical protein [Candidatus Peribacteria bacterium]
MEDMTNEIVDTEAVIIDETPEQPLTPEETEAAEQQVQVVMAELQRIFDAVKQQEADAMASIPAEVELDIAA